jgi:hypothetical protein
LERRQLVTGLANGDDLGMCGWIAGDGDLVGAFGDNLAIPDNHASEWAAVAARDVFDRERNGSRHECTLHFTHNKGDAPRLRDL